MSPLYFLIFCAPLAAVAQPRAATDKCPAIAPLSADECPPKEAAMSDCAGFDCRFGCKPDAASLSFLSPPGVEVDVSLCAIASRRDPDEQLEFQGGELR